MSVLLTLTFVFLSRFPLLPSLGVLRRNCEASGQQVSPPHAAKPSRIPVKLDSPVQIRHRQQQIGSVSANQMVTTPNHHRRRPQSMVERDCNFQVTRLMLPFSPAPPPLPNLFFCLKSDIRQTILERRRFTRRVVTQSVATYALMQLELMPIHPENTLV